MRVTRHRLRTSAVARHKVRFSHDDDTTADEEEEEMSEESSEGLPDCDIEEEEVLPAAPLPPRRSSVENAESAVSAPTERSGSQEFLDTPLRSLSKKLSSVSAMVVPTPSTSQPISPRAPRGSLSQGTRPITLSDQKAAGWKPGIGSSEGLDMRFLLLDNSGSTRKLDGWILVGDGEHKMHGLETDRWCETMSIAVDHAEWNVRHGVRTQLVLLNPPSPKRPLEGRDFVTVDPDLPHHGEQVASVASFLKRNGPCGNTPLTSRLKQLRQRIQSEYAVGATPGATPRGLSGSMPSTPRAGSADTPRAPIRLQKSISPRKMPSITSDNSPRMSKMRSGPKVVQRLALTIVTDGLPTSSDSTSSTAQDKDAFVEELQTWEKEFDCKLVIRLTTDGMGAVGYYKRLAEQVDFKVVVLGNLHCEARRARCNGWLAYSPLVHKMREGGSTDGGVLGRLHEGRLPLGEAVEVLEWLLRTPGEKPLPRDADGLYHAVEKMLPKLNPVYNGRLRCMTPPVDLRLLRRALGLGSAARRLRSLTQVLASALCQKGLPA